MYYEDTFHPSQDNDILNHQKKELNNVKSCDSGYTFVYRDKVLPSGKIKKTRVDCYTSSDSGTNIRNAETGNYYKYKVGSKEEDLFFKIALSSGEIHASNGSNILFYDSPEQYEKHLMYELSDDIKEKWVLKKQQLFANCK
jgi:hypothetical protein